MKEFLENNYQWLITTLLTLIGGAIYFKYKKNTQTIKNNSKGIQAGGDINIDIKINSHDEQKKDK